MNTKTQITAQYLWVKIHKIMPLSAIL